MVDTPNMRPNSAAVPSSSTARISAESSQGSLEAKDPASKDPFRRAMPELEVEQDVCSICLDEFSADDPGVPTRCGHLYHLQCIMQWAQRSRECPLCYECLGLEDPQLHAMLPFGEYVKPEQPINSALTDLGWDIKILQQLSLQPYDHRRSRNRHRHRAADNSQGIEPGQASASIAIPSRNTNEASSSSLQGYPGSWPPQNYSGRESRGAPGGTSNDRALRSNVSAELNNSSETPRHQGESLKSRLHRFQAKFVESFSGKSSSVRQS